MRKVIYERELGEEKYPVEIEIKKRFKIIPPLEQRKTKFLLGLTESVKFPLDPNTPRKISCYLINPEDDYVIREVEFTGDEEVEVEFGSAGNYRWCCGSPKSGGIDISPGELTRIIQIKELVGYKTFRVYSRYELVTVIGAVAAVIAAITGFLALFK